MNTAGTLALDGVRVGLRTSVRLVAVLIPAGFLVYLLELLGLLGPLASVLDPVMGLAGLPGEAALVFATGALVTIFPAIGMLSSLSFTVGETTVIALMILICHNLFVETAVQARVGSNPIRIVAVRVISAFAAAILVGRILGLDGAGTRVGSGSGGSGAGFPGWETAAATFVVWALTTGRTILRITVVVVLIMVAQRFLKHSGVLPRVARVCEPVVVAFGLPRSTAFLWLVGNTLGLTFGAAVILEEREAGDLAMADADLLNHHLAVSHSLLEDTLVFSALGASIPILIIPRLAAALAVVWLRRLSIHLRCVFNPVQCAGKGAGITEWGK